MKSIHVHFSFLIFAVTATGFAGAAYIYMYSAAAASDGRAIAARDVVSAEKLDQERNEGAVSLYQSTSDQRARLKGFFVPNDSAIGFIESVEALSKESGATLVLSAIDADKLKASDSKAIGFVRGHIEGKGSWESVMRALMLAENLPYGVLVDDVRLSTSTIDPGKSATVWNISFDIRAATIIIN